MKRYILTGATGMIALALVRLIMQSADDPEIFCVIRPGSAKRERIPDNPAVHIIECDLHDLDRLPQLIHSRCDVFYHFAWEGTFGTSRNDALLQESNIKYTLDAVNAAHALGCDCFIGAGSQAEYGRSERNLRPDTPVRAETGYGIAKCAAGNLSRLLCQNLGIRHIWARILSVYGPYDGENTLVMSCIRAFLNSEKIALTKGEQIWDYLHCDDAARAFLFMAENGKDGAVYPLGSGTGRPLSEYISSIHVATGSAGSLCFGERPYAEKQVMYLCADLSSLTRDTGFLPEISFDEGIRMTVDWVKDHI